MPKVNHQVSRLLCSASDSFQLYNVSMQKQPSCIKSEVKMPKLLISEYDHMHPKDMISKPGQESFSVL